MPDFRGEKEKFEALVRGLVDARERREVAARGGSSDVVTHIKRNQRRIRSAADPTNPRLSQS
jgi:hypothetical protein